MEQFSRMPDVEVKVIDGFEMMGSPGLLFAKLYGVTTRHAPALFNALWKFTMKHPPAFGLTARLCRRRFAECLRGFHPDLILTVHSCFNTLLSRLLALLKTDIPVVVLQADIINIHSTWCNPRAYKTICPTREAYDVSVRQGMPKEKLKIMGFPVRSRFCEAARESDAQAYDPSQPLKCLMMSGGEGTGHLQAYAESILNHTDAELTIICGRNHKLEHQLAERMGRQYGSRVSVLGFVSDLEQKMLHSDLLITRCSPNTISEAVVMGVPLIIIGPMPEQERDNPKLVQKYNLGVVSQSPEDVTGIIHGLLDNGAARLGEIRASQRRQRYFDHARDIAVYVAELTEPSGYTPTA